MTVYTVHEPPPRGGDTAAEADRFVFVRDGFYFWAFLLGPVWILFRRLWLVLLLYLIAMAALQAGLWALGAAGSLKLAVGFLIAVLTGVEASTLWRWTLARRKWTDLGVVAAADRDTAERRFFDAWIGRDGSPVPSAVSVSVSSAMRRPPSTDVMGLFPEPEPNR